MSILQLHSLQRLTIGDLTPRVAIKNGYVMYIYCRQSKSRTRRISHSAFKSPRELVDHQILELQEQLDQLHRRLKDTMKEGLQEGEGLPARPPDQTATVELKQKNLLRDIETLTKELEKKRQSSHS